MKPALPSGWEWVRLGTALIRKRDLINPSDHPEREFTSVGLEDIGSDGTGEVSPHLVTGAELASSKAQFEQGDLLYGRLRPYLNKVAIAPSQGVSSTEIWVLSPAPIIDTKFAFWMLTSRYMLKQMERVTEGANLPRVDADGFDRVEIPVPPLSEQQRIVEILNEARDIRRLRQQADDLTTQLIPAIFNEMFGDPTTKPVDWPLVSVDEVRKPGKTTIRTGPFGSDLKHDEFVESGFPVLAIDNVVENRFRWNNQRCVTADKYAEFQRFRVFPRDVLVTIMGTVGRTCVAPDDLPVCMSTKHLCVITVDEEQINPYFLWAAFLCDPRIASQTSGAGHGAIMQGWNSGIIRKLRFNLPPKSLQDRFEVIAREVLSTEESCSRAEKSEKQVLASMLAHAFSGKLTADWRTQNREQLAQETAERDHWLRENGVKLTTPDQRSQGTPDPTDGLAWELNREQRALLEQIQNLDRNDNGGLFTLSTLKLDAPLDKLSADAVRRHLDVLAARGLVLAVSRLAESGESVKFGNVYRLPLGNKDLLGTEEQLDHARLSELGRLSRQGRVHNLSGSGSLKLSGSAEISVTTAEGDD